VAEEIKSDNESGQKLGLNKEEKAFYDALLKPEALKDYYEKRSEELVNIVKELTDTLNKNKTIDWQKRETARASMRSMIKKLLKKYKYPPDEIPAATDYVIAQCERWVDNLE
jgi:type I restriction enzyme R subunit